MYYKSFLSKVKVASAVIVLFLAGCGKEEKKVALSSIEVTPARVDLTVGDTEALSAKAVPADAADVVFVWSSADETVATVSNKGVVTAMKEGNTTVKVASGSVEKLVPVAITIAPSITVTPAAPEQAPSAGSSLAFTVAATAGWTYSLSEGANAWLTEAGKTATALTLTVTPNATMGEKTATISFFLTGNPEVKQDVAVSQAAVSPEITVTPAAPEQVSSLGGSLVFAVAANADWTYSLSEGANAWLTEAGKNATTLTLTVSPNATTNVKNATITFSLTEYTEVKQEVAVSQAAFAPEIIVTPTAPEQVSFAGGSLVFAITANAEWTYSLSEGASTWLTEASKTATALTLTVAPNATAGEQTATITFSLTGYSEVKQEVAVSQAAPLIEALIDNKEDWEWYQLSSDNLTWVDMENGDRYHFSKLWDGLNPHDWFAYIAGDLPFSVTIRLGGESVILSRLVMYSAHLFGTSYLPGHFQIYGSNEDTPADDIEDNDWTLLGDFNLAPDAGANPEYLFEVTENIPNPYLPTKFVRFLFLGNGGRVGIGEIDLWGEIQ